MKKTKKKLMGLLLVAIMVMGTTGNIWAEATSNNYSSPFLNTGKWWSGYDHNMIIPMPSLKSKVYGTDVGVYFTPSSVGMPKGYVQSLYRTIEVELREDDNGTSNANETIKKWRGQFELTASGVYKIKGFGQTYYNQSCIESNNVVELYIKTYVEPITGDVINTIPVGLYSYRYWVN